MKNVFWKAYTSQNRHGIINEVQTIINAFGSIVDFKPFSDIAITLVIEVETSKVALMYEALTSSISISGYEAAAGNFPKEITIYLNITFNTGTGTLVHQVPAVPG